MTLETPRELRAYARELRRMAGDLDRMASQRERELSALAPGLLSDLKETGPVPAKPSEPLPAKLEVRKAFLPKEARGTTAWVCTSCSQTRRSSERYLLVGLDLSPEAEAFICALCAAEFR